MAHLKDFDRSRDLRSALISFVCSPSESVTRLIDVSPASVEAVVLLELDNFVTFLWTERSRGSEGCGSNFQERDLRDTIAQLPSISSLELATPQDRWNPLIEALSPLAEKMHWGFGYFFIWIRFIPERSLYLSTTPVACYLEDLHRIYHIMYTKGLKLTRT